MFLANLYLKSRPTPIQFFFSSQASALEAGTGKISGEGEADVTIVDDYGQSATFRAFDCCGWLVIDYAQTIAAELHKKVIIEQTQQKIIKDLGEPRQ